MANDPLAMSRSSQQRSRPGRYFPKWAIYSAGGFGVLVIVATIKALLLVSGMALLLAFIWSQATTNRRY
tara:strand:+ start:1778 stop:1984 length:207 start_codon:yes stop_codon:yes gene_type:complete